MYSLEFSVPHSITHCALFNGLNIRRSGVRVAAAVIQSQRFVIGCTGPGILADHSAEKSAGKSDRDLNQHERREEYRNKYKYDRISKHHRFFVAVHRVG